MKYEIGTCPLCGKALQCRQMGLSEVKVYSCATMVLGESREISHYEVVEHDGQPFSQHMHVIPYGVDNYGDPIKSRIYKITPTIRGDVWRFLLEVPHIKADTASNLLNRIQNLLIFI